ncbi:Uncharacterised protein [Vibrio cholerae]|nr:Uncharacterised protein [Vibrio cholerae]
MVARVLLDLDPHLIADRNMLAPAILQFRTPLRLTQHIGHRVEGFHHLLMAHRATFIG